jgi:hypothetical protein
MMNMFGQGVVLFGGVHDAADYINLFDCAKRNLSM